MCVLELFYKSSWTFGKLFLNFSNIVLELLYIGDIVVMGYFYDIPEAELRGTVADRGEWLLKYGAIMLKSGYFYRF